jgi:rhomboid protease GluP
MNWPKARATLLLAFLMVFGFLFEVADGVRSDFGAKGLVMSGVILPGTLSRMELWRLITALFLHAGILHLLSNLWGVLQLGYAWELLFGKRALLLVFFGSGLAASTSSALFIGEHGSVGASGALFGLLSALIVTIAQVPRWREAAWARRLAWQLGVWAFLVVGLGFITPQIDNAAHVGGLLGGIVMGNLVTRLVALND